MPIPSHIIAEWHRSKKRDIKITEIDKALVDNFSDTGPVIASLIKQTDQFLKLFTVNCENPAQEKESFIDGLREKLKKEIPSFATQSEDSPSISSIFYLMESVSECLSRQIKDFTVSLGEKQYNRLDVFILERFSSLYKLDKLILNGVFEDILKFIEK